MARREYACKRLFGTLPEMVGSDPAWGWPIGQVLQATDPARPHTSYSHELAVQIARAIREVAGWITPAS